jgi:hypothetical protein
MRATRLLFFIALFICAAHVSPAEATGPATKPQIDSDHDGLSDQLEQTLLVQFAPSFMIGRQDCSNIPAQFMPDTEKPLVLEEDGTIYGQVFPSKSNPRFAEIHYYHLWRQDCGSHGHPLDTEHVAVLVRASNSDLGAASWKAVYWYAAAHENTVCDVSQIARASTLHAEEHGAKIWVSPGKHASYLNETLCQRGCGSDKCDDMTSLHPKSIINLGEPRIPMNGSVFISSNAWPLAYKMSNTNFPPDPVARLNQLPATDIAWFNSGRHPAQGIISISSSTQQTIADGGRNTTEAISTAGDSTNSAISVAGDSAGDALQKSYHHTRHALGTSARHVGEALHVTKQSPTPQ